jgi:hypothetical protein
MRIRASVVTIAKVLAVLLVVVSSGAACTHASGKLMVDAPKLLTYEPPDIDELTGIDAEDQPAEAEGAGPGSAQNQQQSPPK